MIVVKIGGSLIGSARELVRSLQEYALNERECIVIVPGGSVFADAVRSADDSYGISEATAHWMAILAMDQYGHYLADGTPATLITGLSEIESTPIGTSIILTYDLLKKSDTGIEETWNATSDTIAGWIASELDATLIKATDVDGIFRDGQLLCRIAAEKLLEMGKTCVDSVLPELLLLRSLDCRVVNGRYPDRVIDALRGGSVGTLITGR